MDLPEGKILFLPNLEYIKNYSLQEVIDADYVLVREEELIYSVYKGPRDTIGDKVVLTVDQIAKMLLAQ